MLIAGIDEAGRGPLAGPVVAAAVILDPLRRVRGLRDSKMMTPEARERVAVEIRANSIAWAVAAERRRRNRRAQYPACDAARNASRRRGARVQPFEALVDGDHCPELGCPAYAIVKGDRDVPAISAASIIAKTARDAMLVALDREYPDVRLRASQGLRDAGAPRRARSARPMSCAPAHVCAGLAGVARFLVTTRRSPPSIRAARY